MAIRRQGFRTKAVESLKILPGNRAKVGPKLVGLAPLEQPLNFFGSLEVGKKAYSTRSAAGVRALTKREMRNAAASRCNNGSSGELSEFILKMLASSRGTTR